MCWCIYKLRVNMGYTIVLMAYSWRIVVIIDTKIMVIFFENFQLNYEKVEMAFFIMVIWPAEKILNIILFRPVNSPA